MLTLQNRLYLASKSPRRRELLNQIGVNFEVILLRDSSPTRRDVDESAMPNELPKDYAIRIARTKAEVAALRMKDRHLPPLPVLSADTCVVLGEKIIGKPLNIEDAANTLRLLSGKIHQVLSAVAISYAGETSTLLSATEVRFNTLSEEQIQQYVSSGEPLDKAGAYGIQGKAAMFISHISGSYSGVMGLPLFETAELLRKIRFPLLTSINKTV